MAFACGRAAPLQAQGDSQMCVQESGNVICRVDIHSFPSAGKPLFVVSPNLIRKVPTTRLTARVFTTDRRTGREQRNCMPLGTNPGGVLAQFNWPVALEGTPRRCVEIEMSECRRITDEPVFCAAAINTMRSRGAVRW